MTDAEKEYRAQWIRDAARDLLIAEAGSERDTLWGSDHPGIAGHFMTFASVLWDLYVKERE